MAKKRNISLAPSDLKDRGVTRSLNYASKVLGKNIDSSEKHWRELSLMQELRNHLVHYGPDFEDKKEHNDKFKKFDKSDYVTLSPVICFTIMQLERLFELYMTCVKDFIKKQPD